MNKDALKKNSWSLVKIRPMAKRFFGEHGPQLPPVDGDWQIQVGDDGVWIRNTVTDHGTLLGYDHIHHYTSDPARGVRNGFLILNVQIHLGETAFGLSRCSAPAKRSLTSSLGYSIGSERKSNEFYFSRPVNHFPFPLTAYFTLHALRSGQEGVRALCHRRAEPAKSSES